MHSSKLIQMQSLAGQSQPGLGLGWAGLVSLGVGPRTEVTVACSARRGRGSGAMMSQLVAGWFFLKPFSYSIFFFSVSLWEPPRELWPMACPCTPQEAWTVSRPTAHPAASNHSRRTTTGAGTPDGQTGTYPSPTANGTSTVDASRAVIFPEEHGIVLALFFYCLVSANQSKPGEASAPEGTPPWSALSWMMDGLVGEKVGCSLSKAGGPPFVGIEVARNPYVPARNLLGPVCRKKLRTESHLLLD
jgi:hypothetical protein